MSLKSDFAIGGGVVVAAAVLLYLSRNQIKSAAEAINPLNAENLLAEGANGTLSAIVGEKTSIGEEVYDLGGEYGNRNLFGRFTDWIMF